MAASETDRTSRQRLAGVRLPEMTEQESHPHGFTEAHGRFILKREFETAGLRITEDFAFSEDGIAINLDGFDPEARAGYEFITTEAGDRTTVTPAIIDALEQKMDAGTLHIFLVDEFEAMTEETLTFAAIQFLKHLHRRGVLK